ncbi:MAG: L-seryl-tRNA(Sec) selenium transferase [Anaerolineae bacterium]|jgi:L-seryl-tRNA(Ser) seleniumtransferase
MSQSELRKLPSVDKLLQEGAVAGMVEQYGRELTLDALRAALDDARQGILGGEPAPEVEPLIATATRRLMANVRPSLYPVINATGVIIHTNLGRAPLSERARQAMAQVSIGYSNLEYDMAAGARGSRYVHAAELLRRLTGAEDALVVNNNASAVLLTLTVLAKDRDVLISRSQLVEIGGGFRIPDVMRQSGARLVEVGTTNRTYVRDYADVLHPINTALLLRVHHSNFSITGFVHEPMLAELVALGDEYAVPVMDDLGSGTLLETELYGLAHEPTIQESIAAGVSVVTASGDKLLGGPQAGLIMGKADLITKLRRHPLARAVRVDKTTLAGLQATLLAYLEGKAAQEIPVWRMIATPVQVLARRARKWQRALKEAGAPMSVVAVESTVGGGSLPGQTLPTRALALEVSSPDALAAHLRAADLPIVARIEDDRLLLDPRTVLPEQDTVLIEVVRAALTTT